MQAQTHNGGAIEATTNTISVGDPVTYTQITASGRGYRFSVKEATVQEITGNAATVRSKNGRTSVQPLHKLTPAGQRNALTRALLGDA
ncbi:hypothetical protein ACSFE6_05650 [Pseudomonas baetica]|uniref:hypothetical protein n=1 Tax=Pseudomonas baetica TaxID=674054 RepID=UPI003EEBFE20